MDLDLRLSFQGEPSRNDPGSENLALKASQGYVIRDGEGISEFPNTRLSLFQNSSNSFARRELQRLYNLFHSWLQPEKHSKDEMISRLVLEQFVINGHCSDRSTLQEKWNASGRNLEKFMEDLTDDGMKQPGFVHVHMQGQEALFSENMPLREVLVHFRKHLATATQTGENTKVPLWTPRDASLETGQENEGKERGGNTSQKTCPVTESLTWQGSQTPSLLIIPEETCPGLEEAGVSLENPLGSRTAEPGPAGSQEGSPEGPFGGDVHLEAEPGFLSRPDQVTLEPVSAHPSLEGNPARGKSPEGLPGAQKVFPCEKCSQVFQYLSRLKVHQRRHNDERPFVCAKCKKGFFQTSDLRVHQRIHTKEKPFQCSTCKRPFSHKTNLRAHERIHTGEKPYLCSFCQRRYRQSSTYNRHLKSHQKLALKGDLSGVPVVAQRKRI
ncbi:zinc finger and SCAN domain-containing protein 4 [Phacochoerus africanus]|uniref:zinc finger and SCAN domain-containing protein 4 n=1 Tax=Phacochoerus africanus TaxID=41426 RepID=UPI001FD9078D|nr:zinc finger and SCAN domain-containing protein 4 [Phacochoerus africanus]